MIGSLETVELVNALYEVLDPETGVNLVDLGPDLRRAPLASPPPRAPPGA